MATDRQPEVPEIWAERDGFRIVFRLRNQATWPGMGDLVLEQRESDAMGGVRWIYLDSWMLSTLDPKAVVKKQDTAMLALRLLCMPGYPIYSPTPITIHGHI